MFGYIIYSFSKIYFEDFVLGQEGTKTQTEYKKNTF